MDNLRLVLFITGILIFAGIYLWEIRKSPPDNRKRSMDPPGGQPDQPASDAAAGGPERIQGATDAMADPDPGMSDPAGAAGAEAGPFNRATGGIAESDNGSAGESPERARGEAAVTSAEPVSGLKNSSVDPEQELITLFITATEDNVFNGADISRAARDAGMMYGPMKIFHYFGSERMQSDQPLFSMANMFEPGAFDLETMSEFETTGIALFIYLSALVEGQDAFDLFINSVREIATTLGGNIRMINQELLDDADIEAMRKRIK